MKKLKLGVLGIDHGHIYDMLGEMLNLGCTCDYWWTKEETNNNKSFQDKFPFLSKVEDKMKIIEDDSIDMILISSIPKDRAILAILAMQNGKDIMVDKPGCTTLEQLEQIKSVVKKHRRIWSVNFSERFQVPAVAKAEDLVNSGVIGKVIQTIGTGPHRQGNYARPDWFYDRESYGGILTDIGSHQVHQFLIFTGSTSAKINHALVQNSSMPEKKGFQDFGEINLTGDSGHGYIRLDWFTPDALPTWGDGRLFILGEKGYIELRKYTDIAKKSSGDHLFYANNTEVKYIDCANIKLPYFSNLISDVLNRTETATSQKITFLSMELALQAQRIAENDQ